MTESAENTGNLDYIYSYTHRELCTLNVADTLAKLREKVAPYRFKLAAKNIVRELELKRGEKILELGSGLGLLGQEIGDEIDGKIDYFGVELAYIPANESKKRIDVPVQADALNLPFSDNSFDAVVSMDVLEHIPDSEKVIGEIHRVLKPGKKAFLVIADPSEGRFRNVYDHIDRTGTGSDVKYWEGKLISKGFNLDERSSKRYRKKDWRRLFNLPFLVKLKDKPGFACAFNPINRPGTYVIEKPHEVPRILRSYSEN